MKLGLALAAPLFAFAAGACAQQDDAELVKKLNNPVASLVSVPFQMNWDFGIGQRDEGTQFKLNFQPVIPVSLNKDWNLIIRTIVPYISQEDVFTRPLPSFPGLPDDVLARVPSNQREAVNDAAEKAFNKAVRRVPVDRHQDGLSDTTQSFFFSPKEPTSGGVIWGLGPVFLYPTATDDLLGTEKWGAGPTGLVLKQAKGWTMGLLANHIWSFAGDEDRRSVNSTYVQPFLNYSTKTRTTFGINTEATYDWNESQWTVPVNVTLSQLVRLGKLPLNFQIGGRYYADGPSGVPEWGLRFSITLLFPAGGRPPTPAEGNSFGK